ncbi:hypothetical protein EAH83_17945 [Variovorax ginsengisoli]|nr:hypothetical protein EAH83_17945 [Variovorax ginsengisoli]
MVRIHVAEYFGLVSRTRVQPQVWHTYVSTAPFSRLRRSTSAQFSEDVRVRRGWGGCWVDGSPTSAAHSAQGRGDSAGEGVMGLGAGRR